MVKIVMSVRHIVIPKHLFPGRIVRIVIAQGVIGGDGGMVVFPHKIGNLLPHQRLGRPVAEVAPMDHEFTACLPGMALHPMQCVPVPAHKCPRHMVQVRKHQKFHLSPLLPASRR